MATSLSYGERYTFGLIGGVPVITNSTDKAEAQFRIRTDMLITGSNPALTISTIQNTPNPRTVYQNGTASFAIGLYNTTDTFTISNTTNLTGIGSTSNIIRIPDVLNAPVHVSNDLAVTGSVRILGAMYLGYREVSVTTTMSDTDYTVCSTGTLAAPGITITLPSGNDLGRVVNVLHRKTAGITVVQSSGSNTIDGDVAKSTSSLSASIQLQSNGSGTWRILSITGSWT